MSAPAGERDAEPSPDDGVKWLALLLRQAFLLVVAAVERRYGLDRKTR